MITTMLLDYPPLVAGQEVEFIEWLPGDKVGVLDMEGKAYQVDAFHVSADFKRGPGRPRFDPAAPTVRTTVRLTQAQMAKAQELGGGNVAQGVRNAIEAAHECKEPISSDFRDGARAEGCWMHDGVHYEQVAGSSGVYLIETVVATGEVIRDGRPWQMTV